jgi:hypothetical protein
MKTYVRLLSYLSKFFVESEIFHPKFIEKSKHKIYKDFFFWKSILLWDNMETYGRSGQTTDDNIIQYMRFACYITKAEDTHPEYVILLFHRNICYVKSASLTRISRHIRNCVMWLLA